MGVSGCDEAEQTPPTALAVATDGGVAEVLATPETIGELFGEEELVYVDGMAERRRIEYTSFSVEGESGFYYAVAEGTDPNGQCFTKAIPLRTLMDGRVGPLEDGIDAAKAPAGDTHTCTGAPCSDCDFTRTQTGEITGCTCAAQPQGPYDRCNHTVTSG